MRKLCAAAVLFAFACQKTEDPPAKPAEPAPKPAVQEAPKPPPPKPLTPDQAAARVKECYGYWSAKDAAKFESCMDQTTVLDMVDSGQPPATGAKQVVSERAKPFWDGFPDVKIESQLILVNGGNVATLDLMTGTNSAAFMGQPATNKKIGLYMAHVIELDPVKPIALKVAAYMDAVTLMGQLGVLPAEVRPVLDKGWPEQKVVIAKDDQTEKANVAAWNGSTELWNKHDVKAFDMYADDAVFHDMGLPKDTTGKKPIIKAMQGYWKSFSDLKGSYASVWGAGDWIVAAGSVSGTNDGDIPEMKLKKTGKTVTLQTVELVRFEGGKVKDHWIFYNGMAMAQQLGLVPPQK